MLRCFRRAAVTTVFVGLLLPAGADTRFIDLGTGFDDFDGLLFRGVGQDDLFGFSCRGAGDVNGDGYADFLIAAPSQHVAGRGAAGVVYLVYGGPHLRNSGSPFDVAGLTPEQGLMILAENDLDALGSEVSGGFDYNGDGYDDILLGAFLADKLMPVPKGTGYILWGGPEGIGKGGVYDLRDISPSRGHRIKASRIEGALGHSVSGVGDINHDGLIDVMFGAGFAPNEANIHQAGEHYILFGTEAPFPSTDYPLAQLHLDLNSDGKRDGLTIEGIKKQDYVGFRMAGTGDVDGDGVDDFMTSTWNWNSTLGEWDPVEMVVKQLLNGYGALFVFFGNRELETIDLETLTGDQGVWIKGLGRNHQLGIYAAGSGDFNGDGLNDILGGARFASPNEVSGAGLAYLIYGGGLGGAHLPEPDLHQLSPEPPSGAMTFEPRGISMEGTFPNGNVGTQVATAGDVNGDGFFDFLIGAPGTRLGGGTIGLGGVAYLFLGREGVVAPTANANIDEIADFAFHHSVSDQWTGISLSGVGDVDGDGFGDFLVGTAGATNGGGLKSGTAWLLFGGPSKGAGKEAVYRTHLAAGSLLEKQVGSNRSGTHPYPFSRLWITPGFELSSPEVVAVTIARALPRIAPSSETAKIFWKVQVDEGADGATVRVQYQAAEVAHLGGALRLAWSAGEEGVYTELPTSHDSGRRILSAAIPQAGTLFILGTPDPIIARLVRDVPPIGTPPDRNGDGVLDCADLVFAE